MVRSAEAIGAVVPVSHVQVTCSCRPRGDYPVLESCRVVQVSYFRATDGKRLLRMSPLHHHFEMAGLSETKVTVRFWLVTAAGVALAMTIAGTGPLSR